MKLIGAVLISAALVFVILLIPELRNIFSIPLLPTQNIIELICLILLRLLLLKYLNCLELMVIMTVEKCKNKSIVKKEKSIVQYKHQVQGKNMY